jgi:hypothetical protein
VIPLFGRATPAQRLAAEDQMLAVVREFGPLRTQAIAAAMPRAWYVTCGHEDCERPEHRKETFYAGWPISVARRYLDRLERQGRVVRSAEVPRGTHGHLWAVPISVPDGVG